MKSLPYVKAKIGDREYNLKISAMTAIELEEKTGKSIVEGMGDFDKVKILTLYLHAALKALNSSVTTEEVYEIYDDYIAGGKNMGDMCDLMIEVLTVSGFLKRQQTEKMLTLAKEMEKLSQPQE